MDKCKTQTRELTVPRQVTGRHDSLDYSTQGPSGAQLNTLTYRAGGRVTSTTKHLMCASNTELSRTKPECFI